MATKQSEETTVDTDVGVGERDADTPGIAHLTVVPENAE